MRLLILLAFFQSASAWAGAQWLPQLLREVETKYSKAPSLSMQFTQSSELTSTKQTKISSGTIEFKRPGKIRWETLKPDPSLLVSNGNKFWIYTPPFDESEHGQVIEGTSIESQSKLATALLSGAFSVAKDMKIRAESALVFSLTPKPGAAGTVKRALIQIDPNDRLIKKVTLEHRQGNRTEISLSQIELSKNIDDSRFTFTPPPHTDHIKQ